MKEKLSGLLNKSKWILISCLFLIPLLVSACGGGGEPAASTNQIKVDNVCTASNVSMVNGLWDWKTYVKQSSFPSGYKGTFWVMFNFSNVLHDNTSNIKTNIYILSNGQIKAEHFQNASITNTTDNTLWWGDLFDISSYPNGNYSVIVNVIDLTAGTSAAKSASFKIGAAP